MPRRPVLLAALLASVVAMASVQAATVTAVVTDAAGAPLTDFVVMLEPPAGHAPAKPMSEVQIAQKNKQFQPQLTVVTVGTSVLFPNLDTVRHHVYSFSPAKTFQIKLYAGVPQAPIVFDKAGVAVLGCNIHDDMIAWVVVVDTPFWARGGAGGHARIEGVPPGNYQVRLWHASLGENVQTQAAPLVVAAADVEQALKLNPVGPGK